MKGAKEVRFLCAVCLLLTLAFPSSATTSSDKQAGYDVVSIKPTNPHAEGMKMEETADGLSARNTTLKLLLQSAYGLRADQISGGPSWLNVMRFDVDAKSTDAAPHTLEGLTPPQRSLMLQQLLRDYFKVQCHESTKVGSIYRLTVDKGGPKLKPVSVESESKTLNGLKAGSMQVTSSLLTAHDVPLSSLTNFLSTQLGRDVVDQTNLSGKYDILMTWGAQGSDLDSDDTSLFVVLREQLGLRLQAASGPVRNLVIDRASIPAPN